VNGAGRRIESHLAHLVSGGAETALVADAAVATWWRVHQALSPIIGHGGVDALVKRSLYLVRVEQPRLFALHDELTAQNEYAALHAALARESPAGAALSHDALLQAFCDLLGSLIGASLTERLLEFLWDAPCGGPATTDTSTP